MTTASDALTCDADHTYRLGDRKVRGVSEILKAVGVSDHSSPWYTEEARAYGKNLHACLALLVAGTLDFDSVDLRLLAEVEAVADWLAKIGPYQVLAVEWKHYSPTYGFAGTLDVALRLANGRVALIDWKRGAADKACRLQTAAYSVLASEGLERVPLTSIDRYALDGIKTRDPKVRPMTDRSDIAAFLGFAAGVNWADVAGLKLQGDTDGHTS